MTAPRFDVYTLVHKGQRRKLFELTGLAGQIGGEEAGERQALAAAVNAFLNTLVEHGEFEDRFLGPLLVEAAPETQARLHAEHVTFEREFTALRALVDRGAAAPSPAHDLELYRALARFTAQYIAHVEIEESAMPALWARYDDAHLAKTQGALVAAHPPSTVAYNLSCMLPAASSAERIGFLSGLKRNLPAPAFAGVRANVSALVDAREWAAIDAA